jgi:exo-1,4-beta-D-glucosaminidase
MKIDRTCAWWLVWMSLAAPAAAQPSKTALAAGWQLQSSAKVQADGATISIPSFRPTGWYRASMPSTVLAALVANSVYPDPFFGMNLRSIPGTSYAIGRNFSNLDMPSDSPFRVSWWFRTTFTVPAAARGGRVSLQFDGINYRANIWLNGKPIAVYSNLLAETESGQRYADSDGEGHR